MHERDSRIKLGLALLLPFLAWGLQTLLWDFIHPHVWFFFYPAVFLGSWLGGRAGGLLATMLSIGLVNYFFMEPIHSFHVFSASYRLSLVMFS